VVPTLLLHNLLKETPQVVVVGLLFEFDIAAIRYVLKEFLGDALGQLLDSGLAFLLTNLVILIVFVLARKTLPWESALQEVKQDVADRFEVISAGLLNTGVTVN